MCKWKIARKICKDLTLRIKNRMLASDCLCATSPGQRRAKKELERTHGVLSGYIMAYTHSLNVLFGNPRKVGKLLTLCRAAATKQYHLECDF